MPICACIYSGYYSAQILYCNLERKQSESEKQLLKSPWSSVKGWERLLSMIWSCTAQLSGSFTPRVGLVNWSRVSSGLRCCSLFFRLSDPMSGRRGRWLPGGPGAKAWDAGVRQTHSKASPLGRGIMINKACPTPAPGQHNGNSAGQWRRRDRAVIRGPRQWNGLH